MRVTVNNLSTTTTTGPPPFKRTGAGATIGLTYIPDLCHFSYFTYMQFTGAKSLT